MVKTTAKLIVTSVVMVATGIFVTAPVYASSIATDRDDADCSAKMVGTSDTTNKSNSRWTMNDHGVVTGKIVVSGDDGCTQTVTLAAWQAPNAVKGQPYDQQKLVDHMTATFSKGTHSLSIAAPNCFYQIDMVRGGKATGPDGTAKYEASSLMGSLHGGTKACEVTTVTPQTPQTPSTPETPQAPAELVNTGAGSTAFTFAALAAVVGAVAHFAVRRTRMA